MADGAFDGVAFFNVIQALREYERCLAESIRVARRFVLLNSIHVSNIARHPRDYNRLTEDRLAATLDEIGRAVPIEYRILPLGGAFTSAVSLIDPYLRFRLFRFVANCTAAVLDRLDRLARWEAPLQYLVWVKKV